jgi:hypothetical protein
MDAPIATWFPMMPNATKITVDRLLPSGLHSFTDPAYRRCSQNPGAGAAGRGQPEAQIFRAGREFEVQQHSPTMCLTGPHREDLQNFLRTCKAHCRDLKDLLYYIT